MYLLLKESKKRMRLALEFEKTLDKENKLSCVLSDSGFSTSLSTLSEKSANLHSAIPRGRTEAAKPVQFKPFLQYRAVQDNLSMRI
jgi:hypothetical protein